MIDQVFHVATEFRFDIGQALLSTKTLQDSVNQVSDAADNALMSFQHLGAGLVAHLGLGSGGLLAILGKAVSISDKFNSSSLSFSNVISSNMKVFGGTIDTFNERLATSQMIMENINKVANQFALPSGELLTMTKLLTPLLAQHGMAGTNFSNSIDISKNVLKSAPNLGIDPRESEGQLLRMIGGQAGMHDTLFRRLMTETSAFRDNKITNSGQFNSMRPEKRIQLVSKALSVFASDSDVLKNRVNSLHGQLTVLSNNFVEFGSVLRPIGDALLKPIVAVLQEINHFIDGPGRDIAKSMGKMIANIFDDPKKLLIDILQVKQLGADTRKGGKMLGLIEMFLFLRHLKDYLPAQGMISRTISAGFKYIGEGLMFIVQLIPFMAIFKFAMNALWFGISRILPGMIAAVGVFQTLSRAKAIANITDAKRMLDLTPKIADLMLRFKVAIENIFLPIGVAIDGLANFIAPLFSISNWADAALPVFDALVSIFESLGVVSILAYAGFQGLVFGILQFVDNIRNGKILGAFNGVGDAFNAGVNDILDKNAARLSQPGAGVTNQVTNIGKVEIRNDFKENQEPDRIAYTLKDQLLKAAKNPTQGRGTALQGAFAR
jgi:hypothetical protein